MRSLRSAQTATKAARIAARPACQLPCWPACRAASGSAAAWPLEALEAEVPDTVAAGEERRSDSVVTAVSAVAAKQSGSTVRTKPRTNALPDSTTRWSSIDAAVAALPPAEWASRPAASLSAILRLPASPAALAALLPVVTAQSGSADARLRTLGRYVRACVRGHALIYLRPAVEYALRVLADATRAEAASAGDDAARRAAIRCMARYHRFLRSLASPSPAAAAPSAIQNEISRVVTSLLATLDSISSPTMPTAALHLRPRTLDALLSPSLATPDTAAALLRHAQQTRTHLTPAHWVAAATVYLRSSRADEALRCLAHATPEAAETPHRLMAAQGTRSLEDTVRLLEPLLEAAGAGTVDSESDSVAAHSGDATAPTSRAWSILVARAAADETVSAAQLDALASSLPPPLITAHTLTPAIHGLVRRNDLGNAHKFWRRLQRLSGAAELSERRRFVDAAALSVAAELEFARNADKPDPMQRALKVVDYYGAKAGANRQRAEKRLAQRHPSLGTVPLDTQVLNVLLHQAGRAGRPGVAFRLWEAASPRWGVWHDDVSLTLLLDAARTCVDRGFDPGLDSFSGRWRALASALKTSPDELQDAVTAPPSRGWRDAPLNALLGNPATAWHEEFGTPQPWARARALFRAVVLGNWPALGDVPSPLGERGGTLRGLTDLIAPPRLPRGPSTAPPPAQGAAYAHIVPSPSGWQAYIAVLRRWAPEFGDDAAAESEVARALAWMRALGTRPTWRTTLEALMHVGEHEGPRRRVRIANRTVLARDEEILRAWLAEWLPHVPSETDVAAFRRAWSERARGL